MARARRGLPLDGVLLLDKPSGITSNLALQKARRLLNAAKAGHTGTLDPLASGLLPLTFGEATKFSADLLDADKAYVATLQLGARTTTGDAEGEVIETRPVDDVTRERLVAVLTRFTGTIAQVPPMHSALKKDGRALYEYARQGVAVERAPRTVEIRRLQLVSFAAASAQIEVKCSKGTYVRVLAEDIGHALGCGAHLAALRRTRVGALPVEDAITLEALEALPMEARPPCLRPMDVLISGLWRVELDEAHAARFLQGQRLRFDGTGGGRVRVYGPDARLLGVAELTEDGVLAPQRLVNSEHRASAGPRRAQETDHGPPVTDRSLANRSRDRTT